MTCHFFLKVAKVTAIFGIFILKILIKNIYSKNYSHPCYFYFKNLDQQYK